MNFIENIAISQIISIPKQIFKILTSVRFGNTNESPPQTSSKTVLDAPSWCSRFLEPANSPLMPRASLLPMTLPSNPSILKQTQQKPQLKPFTVKNVRSQLFLEKQRHELSRFSPRCDCLEQCCSYAFTQIEFRKYSRIAYKKYPLTYKTGGRLRKYTNFKDKIFNRFSGFCKKYVEYMSPMPCPMKMHIVIDHCAPGKTKLELHPVAMTRQARVTPMREPPSSSLPAKSCPGPSFVHQYAPFQLHPSFESTYTKSITGVKCSLSPSMDPFTSLRDAMNEASKKQGFTKQTSSKVAVKFDQNKPTRSCSNRVHVQLV